MIDIHTHILPMVDDGSKSTERSLEMLKEEVSQGVKAVILTPHYRGRFASTPESLKVAFDEFCGKVAEEKIPIELYLGREVCISSGVKACIKEDRALCLANSNYILIEFDFFNKVEASVIAHELKHAGLLPIIAHAERYAYLTLNDVYEIKRAGGLIQVNAESILGELGRGVKKFVKKMFEAELVDFVASDVHAVRNNRLLEARTHVERKYGLDVAERVFNLNAKKILEG